MPDELLSQVKTPQNKVLLPLALILPVVGQAMIFYPISMEGGNIFTAIIFFAGFFVFVSGIILLSKSIRPKQEEAVLKRGMTFNIFVCAALLLNVVALVFSFFVTSLGLYAAVSTYVFRPAQKFEANVQPKIEPAMQGDSSLPKDLKSYVYWVHVKGQYESGCCGVRNPSKPTPDETYYFRLNVDAQPDPRGYEGVVCSPDCDGKVIWSGPVTFSEGTTSINRSLVAGQVQMETIKSYNLVLTPSGQLGGSYSDLEHKIKAVNTFYEIDVKKPGCQEEGCVVKRKIVAGSPTNAGTLAVFLGPDDNIVLLSSYDVYLCETSCTKNKPRPNWNPKKCVARTRNLFLTFAGEYTPLNANGDYCS